MRNKRGQSAVMAGVFIAVIGLIIIFYILLLSPEDRADLLGEPYPGSSSGSYYDDDDWDGSKHVNVVLLSESQIQLDYIKTRSKDYNLPAFRISTVTQAEELKIISSIYVQNGVMDQESYNFTFTIDEDLTEDLMLSFNVKKSEGRLIIYLNGYRLVNTEVSVGSPSPIILPEDQLREKNTIHIAVSGVGWAFWKYNDYVLENVKITADVTDVSGSSGSQRFYIAPDEYDNIDEVKVRFYPDCKLDEVGPLIIRINGVKIYDGIGDCGTYSIYVVGKESIMPGSNTLTFSTEEGSYLIDQVKIIVELEELTYPVYYFELDDKYFTTVSEEEDADCGKIDGICPDDCEEDEDKDCCFDYSNNYWCDVEPRHADDRCVSYVDEFECTRCSSGYEDEDGDPAEACEDLCGDDTDGDCPIGCSMYYDMDCCFEVDDDNYWCDDVPIDGITSVCEEGVDTSECDDCPDGYYNEDGDEPDCPSTSSDDDDEELKSRYDVTLSFVFPNREDHKATIRINGYETNLNTNKLEWAKNIDVYLRPKTNSLEIIPLTAMDITEMEVKIED